MAKQRQIRVEQRSALSAMQDLENRSDAELESETKYRSAAYAILGARAAERYDADSSRAWFQKAIAAARPQERMALKRMADASLALAERRAGDLKEAVQKLGSEAPSNGQMFLLRLMGIVAPTKSASLPRRIFGPISIVLLVATLIAISVGIIELVALPLGGVTFGAALLYGILLLAASLGALVFFGRRRQQRARSPKS
ncbi:MAG: hypothetical protein WCI34_03740 [Actinomycetes bacterium]|uniref:Unannotated protein n=1 Tax=freshwater metagenome TaxID=449393 RepID=A0A6J7EA35_9ZZZZ|nr:hypothetical protein [Actinomycetota bacterium]